MTRHHYPMPHDRYSATPRNALHHYARGGAVRPSSQTYLRLTEGGGTRAEGYFLGYWERNQGRRKAAGLIYKDVLTIGRLAIEFKSESNQLFITSL